MERAAVIERLAMLVNPWWEEARIEEHYGIRMPADELMGRFRAWARNRRRPIEVERPGKVHRWAFESYLQSAQLVPLKWAAATRGMSAESFQEVLGEIENRNMNLRDIFAIEDQLVDEVFLQDFNKLFSDLQGRFIADHNVYCEVLHDVIEKELSIQVAPLWCITSQVLGEDPCSYAHDFDAITQEPVGLRWQIWLEFNKPINLHPDVCATKTFAEHRDLLDGRLYVGQSPEVPEQLRHGEAR